jgi:hypothetical protein
MRSRADATPTPTPAEARRLIRTAARALLVALGVVLPFEIPLGRLGPVTVTTVEAVMYLLLGAWMLEKALAGPARVGPGLRRAARDPLDRAVALWFGALIVCAATAPAHRVAAAKFTLRALGGGLVFFAARDLLGDGVAVARRLVLGVLVGAVGSATGAVAETVLPSSAALWHSFRTTTFTVTGLPRPSGPFEYPTIAAMYWEATLALAVALPHALAARRARTTDRATAAEERGLDGAGTGPRVPGWVTGAAIGAAAVLVGAILLSATRSALVVAALAAGAMALWAFWWPGGQSKPAGVAGHAGQSEAALRAPLRVVAGSTLLLVALLAGVTLASPAGASPLAARLRWWQDGSWYLARYSLEDRHLTMAAGSVHDVPITVENAGGLAWPHAGADSVRLSYHWEKNDETGAHLDFEGRRSPLPSDVSPGAQVRLLGAVQAPDRPGRYRLRWDLVREHVTWFSERGNPTGDQLVDVVQATATTRTRRPSTIVDSTLEEWVASYVPSRPELWRAAVDLWRRHPVSGVGPDNFRRAYTDVLPSGARPFGVEPGAAGDERIHANSLYFETLADMGLVGTLALGWMMLTIGRVAWRAWRTPSSAGVSGAGASGAGVSGAGASGAAWAVAVGTFFVHGLLDWFFEFTPTYGLFWLLLALLATTTATGTATTTPGPPRSG